MRSRETYRPDIAISMLACHQHADPGPDLKRSRAAAALGDEDTPEGAAETNDEFLNFELYFDLDRGDWTQLKQELKTVLDRWRERSAPAPDRHTYQMVGFGANRQDLDDVRAAAKKRRSDR